MPAASAHPRQVRSLLGWRWGLFAFGYWLACMAALEPGNVANGLAVGHRPDWAQEAGRLACAGLLGAAATPALLWLARRVPVRGARRLRNAAWQGLAIAALAAALVAASCVLVSWVFHGRLLPSAAYVRSELLTNGFLVGLCLTGFAAIVQAAGRAAPGASATRAAAPWATRLTTGERGRLTVIPVQDIDWIETQGNYQALHVGGVTHLVRESSASLLARLDPVAFVRIHRRAILALDRVRAVRPLANGDALVELSTGETLRLARSHRAALLERIRSARPTSEAPPSSPGSA
jgi:hypothetical protein